MLSKSSTPQGVFWPIPHQLCWGECDMGNAISCTKWSRVAGFIYAAGRSSMHVQDIVWVSDWLHVLVHAQQSTPLVNI